MFIFISCKQKSKKLYITLIYSIFFLVIGMIIESAKTLGQFGQRRERDRNVCERGPNDPYRNKYRDNLAKVVF